MKQRFSSLDLQIIASELRSTLIGHRLSNIYDLTSRIFLLKFALPNSKHLLVIDSGFRVHITSFVRETAPTQSSFVTKLRKHLRTRRLTAINQLGIDRVLDLQFSDGLYHLYLEFFAGGNVILTDADKKILAVLRIVSAGEDGRGECKVGATYETTGRDVPPPVDTDKVRAVLEEAVKAGEEPEKPEEETKKPKRGKFQRRKKKGDDPLKRVLGSRMPEFSPVMVEHVLLDKGVDPGMKAQEVLADEEVLGRAVEALKEAEGMVRELTGAGEKRGYIIAKLPKPKAEGEKKEEGEVKKNVAFGSAEAVEKGEDAEEEVQQEGAGKGLVFDDFHPFKPRQFEGVEGVKVLEYDGFNTTVDTFFSSIEAQKLESRLRDREEAAAKRLADARNAHQKRLAALQDVQGMNVRKAQAIEANKGRVEEAIAAVNALVAQGMDWVAMGRLIENEQKRGNAVAELIQLPLKLYENTITLRLQEASWEEQEETDSEADESEEEEDSEDEEAPKKPKKQPLLIDVDLASSAWANARHYYDQKKTAAQKETKTAHASEKALKSTERKIQTDLQRTLATEKQLLRPVRKSLWFEKFLFFISSDGYLCLGARDLQQAEILYKKHFKHGDVWVHADVNGAAPVVVKNKKGMEGAEIPPGTLQQAGGLSVCTSSCWEQKAVMGGWWVGFEQVSKVHGMTGDLLDVGRFEIKGEKNHLPPAQLLLGYGVLWRVDEESAKRHRKHRVEEPEEPTDEKKEARAETPTEKPEKHEEKAEEKEESEEESEEEEDSDDEEFPDVQVEPSDEKPAPTPAPAEEPKPEPVEEQPEEQPEQEGTPEPEDNKEDTSSSAPKPGSKPRLSAKQRRDMKKGKLPTPSGTTPSTPVPSTPAETIHASTPSQKQEKQPKKPLPRGKRSKAKRAAQQYANQDEEDRALALELLGIAPAAPSQPETPSEPKETPEQRKARLREQHRKAAQSDARRHLDAPDEEDDQDREGLDLDLSHLIPDPLDGDKLLDAIPVCAPWGAMGKYKYRVKMQPGTQKKGKAVREVWGGWVRGMKGEEKEMVEGWREAEVVGCVPVKTVKIVAGPGGGKDEKGGKGGKGGKGKGGGPKGGKAKKNRK